MFMFDQNIRNLVAFCTILLAISNCVAKPIIHYGRCTANGETGYCQRQALCWESIAEFSNKSRSPCFSQLHKDLVCCRHAITIAENVETSLRLSLPEPGVCGITHGDGLSVRIIDGDVTDIDEYPWMALLRASHDDIEYSHTCGGSLIHERWVLTAAHCVRARIEGTAPVRQVRLGEWDTTTSPDCKVLKTSRVCAPPHIDVDVDRIIVHEQYTPANNYANDIALLRLNRTVEFTEFVLPICLPAASTSEAYTYAGSSVEIAGWGNTETIRFGGSPLKMKAELRTMTIASCREIYSDLQYGQVCANGDKSQGTCTGDSGGPLMLLSKGTGTGNGSSLIYSVTGIVSLGSLSCNNTGIPMIFTRVEHYITWIKATMQANA